MKKIIAKIEKLNGMQKAFKAINDEIGQLSDQWCESYNKTCNIHICDMNDEQRAEFDKSLDLNSQIVAKNKERAAIEKKFIKAFNSFANEFDIIAPSETFTGCCIELNDIVRYIRKALVAMSSRLTITYEEISLY